MTLQEGNRVLQEHIDRLNQELREQQVTLDQQLKSAQETGQGLATERHALTQQVAELTKHNQKLHNDAQWLRHQRDFFRQSISAQVSGAHVQTFSIGLSPMINATQQTLQQHGYPILAQMETDQKAVFITARKTSASSSLELPGFRNQYLLVVEGIGHQATTLTIKAHYEKISQDGKLLVVSDNEQTDIEIKMLRAIEDRLQKPAEAASNK